MVNKVQYSHIRKYLRPLVAFKTAIETDRPAMREHLKCASYLAAQAQLLGMRTQILPSTEIIRGEDVVAWDRFRDEFRIGKVAPFHSIWATMGGESKGAETTLIFLGHYDVVPAFSGTWLHDPYVVVREGERVIGRGTGDMKGGISAQLAAVKVFTGMNEGFIPSARIAFLFTPLEEKGGRFGAKAALEHLIANGEINPAQTNFVVVGESTSLNVLTVRRAGYQYEIDLAPLCPCPEGVDFIEFHGELGHAGSFNVLEYRNRKERNVLYEMARAFATGQLSGHPVWFEVGRRGPGGIIPHEYNVIPAICRLAVKKDRTERDITIEQVLRYLFEISEQSNWTEESISGRGISLNSYFTRSVDGGVALGTNIRILNRDQSLVQGIFEAAAIKAGLRTGTRSDRFMVKRPAFDQRGSRLSIVAGEIVNEVTGITPNLNFVGIGCSDGQFAAALGLDVIEIGPVGIYEHGDNEYTTVSSLVDVGNISLRLIERILANNWGA